MGWAPFYRTSNQLKRTQTSFFEHWTNLNMFIYWWSNSNTLFRLTNYQTSNIKSNRAFITFTKLFIELIQTSFFRISNELEHVIYWLWTIKLSNFEHCLTHNYQGAVKCFKCNYILHHSNKPAFLVCSKWYQLCSY